MEDQIKELQARLMMVIGQRNDAMNNVAVLGASLTMVTEENQALKEKIKSLEEVKLNKKQK